VHLAEPLFTLLLGSTSDGSEGEFRLSFVLYSEKDVDSDEDGFGTNLWSVVASSLQRGFDEKSSFLVNK
jgi:hypothetical protein